MTDHHVSPNRALDEARRESERELAMDRLVDWLSRHAAAVADETAIVHGNWFCNLSFQREI